MQPVEQAERCFVLEGEYGVFKGIPAGVSAGFTTRRNDERLAARRLAGSLSKAIGVPSARIALARQVHGRSVLVVDGRTALSPDGVVGIGDALVTREAGTFRVLVTSYSPGETGSYTLTVRGP